MTDRPILTTESGAPVADNQHSQTAGTGGPVLLQDHALIEKLARFERERIPERVVHAKGSGAYGRFEVTRDVSAYTRAAFLSAVGKRTEVFVRFSTVAGEQGSADTVRDPRGFAVKFYTEQGNYDLVGNDTPIFFMRDPVKFPDFIHSQKRDPYTQRARARQRLGLLLALARSHTSVHLAVRRPRHPRQLPAHGWLRLAHVPVGERRGATSSGSSTTSRRTRASAASRPKKPRASPARTRTTTTWTCCTPSSAASFPPGR